MYRDRKLNLSSVHQAAEEGSIPKVEQLLAHYLKRGNNELTLLQEKEDLMGVQPLQIAAERGHLKFVKFLLDKEVDVNSTDNDRVTALHLAAVRNELAIAQLLIENGAKSTADKNGETPLHWAAARGHSEIMRMLVDAGASTEATSKDGWTPLHFAAINGKANAVVLLAQGGADLNAVNQAGDTALHLAIRNNCLGVADELLRLGALNTLVNAQGQLAWDFCLNPGAKDLLSSCDKDGRLKELLNKRVAQQLTTQTEAANWEGDALGLLPPGASGNTVDDSRATAQLAGMDQEWSGSPEGAARDAAGSISGWSEGGADQGGAGQAGFVPAKRAALLARYRQQAVAAAKDVDSGPDSLSMSRASGFGPAASSGGWSQNTNAAAIASSAAAFTSRRNLLDKGVAARNSTTAHDEPATKAAAGGAATKAAAGGTGGSKTGLKGPAKNKKFLERYGLDKMQLFSP